MRRSLPLALVALGGAAAALGLRPGDRGAPHAPFFAGLQSELAARGPGKPVLVLDLDALDANLAAVRETVPSGLAIRIVAKSLPSIPLLRHVTAALGATRLMVFDGSMGALADAFSSFDLLAGKPFPIRLLEDFHAGPSGRERAERVTWLVDDRARLEATAALGARLGLRLRVSLEIDVGLHRGGFATPAALGEALAVIAAEPTHLRFAGLMGYDPQAAAAPALLRARAFEAARARYADFVERVRAHDPSWLAGATLNGAGSKTYPAHRAEGPLSEVALGSALVLPTDFDVPALARHRPAIFIATPVLKALEGTAIPFLERLTRWWPAWDPNRARSYFVFGGGWLAKPVSPAGLVDNPVYGFSTNQALLNGSARTALRAEDWVFLRPTQSERVMQELGPIHLVRGGRLEGTWPALPFA